MGRPPKIQQADASAKDMPWEDATRAFLPLSVAPFMYTDIAERIISGGLTPFVGATPETTVSVYLNRSLGDKVAISSRRTRSYPEGRR